MRCKPAAIFTATGKNPPNKTTPALDQTPMASRSAPAGGAARGGVERHQDRIEELAHDAGVIADEEPQPDADREGCGKTDQERAGAQTAPARNALEVTIPAPAERIRLGWPKNCALMKSLSARPLPTAPGTPGQFRREMSARS